MHNIVLALHVIGSGLMLGVVLFALLIYFKKSIDPYTLKNLKTIMLIGTVGAIWQLLTGLYLFLVELDEFKDSKIFWIKIILYFIDGILAVFIIDRKIKQVEKLAEKETSLNDLVSWGSLSLMIILSIIILGVYLKQ